MVRLSFGSPWNWKTLRILLWVGLGYLPPYLGSCENILPLVVPYGLRRKHFKAPQFLHFPRLLFPFLNSLQAFMVGSFISSKLMAIITCQTSSQQWGLWLPPTWPTLPTLPWTFGVDFICAPFPDIAPVPQALFIRSPALKYCAKEGNQFVLLSLSICLPDSPWGGPYPSISHKMGNGSESEPNSNPKKKNSPSCSKVIHCYEGTGD